MIKDYISQALLHLMQKKAYSQITIQEITAEAGVNRSTYYRNFTSKETIIQYIFGEIIDKFDAYAGEPLELSLPSCLPEMFHHFYKYQKTFLIIHKAGLSHLLLNALTITVKRYTVLRMHNSCMRFIIIREESLIHFCCGSIRR